MNTGFLEELIGSEYLLVVFSGYLAKHSKPTFQFYSVLKDLECDKVFVRDLKYLAYLDGVDEEISDFEMLHDRLKEIIEKHPYKKVCFMGSSMGAFASIMLATRLNVDTVLAFSPPTFFNRLKRKFYKEDRWADDVDRLYKSRVSKSMYDLKRYLKRHKNYQTKIILYFSTLMPIDTRHANRMKRIKHVELRPINEGGHNLVRVFVRKNELIPLLKSILFQADDHLSQT